jgi:hypothetical protein
MLLSSSQETPSATFTEPLFFLREELVLLKTAGITTYVAQAC